MKKSTETERKNALTDLAKVIKDFENQVLEYHDDVTRKQVQKEFWQAVAAHYSFKIIDTREPQPAPICTKCQESL